MAKACNLAASRDGGNLGLVLVSRSKKWDATAGERREKKEAEGRKGKKKERVARWHLGGWREIYWNALKFVAFMVRCVGTRSTGAGQRSTLIYASWKTLLTFCQETCVAKYSLEEKLLEVETLRFKRVGFVEGCGFQDWKDYES